MSFFFTVAMDGPLPILIQDLHVVYLYDMESEGVSRSINDTMTVLPSSKLSVNKINRCCAHRVRGSKQIVFVDFEKLELIAELSICEVDSNIF